MQVQTMLRRLDDADLGTAFLGVATILYGIACFLQGDFHDFWQPVPENLPLRQPLAYLIAGLLVVGGSGLLMARTVSRAAMLVLLIFAMYGACYLRLLIGPPFNTNAVMGLAEQLAVVVGAWVILQRVRGGGPAGATIARITFGVCSLIFGLAHFVARVQTANMVPEWMPGGQMFWAVATGVGHAAVGLGLIANRFAVPATRLGALMYLCFVLFAWLPGAFTHPTQWLRWEGASISLCMAAALWLVGDLLASPQVGNRSSFVGLAPEQSHCAVERLRHAAELHGCSTLFFEHGVELILGRIAALAGARARGRPHKLDRARLGRVFELIEAQLAGDLSIAQMAAAANYEASAFTRAFRQATGSTPFAYLTARRMERAALLLEAGEPVTRAALAVGYANASKFAAAFQRRMGAAPRQWRDCRKM
ncbi:helix-turn-helix domain-containing protein [Sphingomonas sp. DT-207]